MKLRILLSSLALLVVFGCGKMGDPTPPPRYVPKTTEDLSVQQRGAEVTLTFLHPKTTVGGGVLTGLEAVELWQIAQPVAEGETIPEIDPREFEAAATLVMSVSGAELTGAVSGERIVLRHRLEEEAEPTGYTFGVRTVATTGERSDLSNQVTLVPAEPPPAPSTMIVLAAADGIRIHWESDAPDLEGFHVYRRDARNRQYGAPLERLGAEEREFLDETAGFGERYIYALRAVASAAPLVESATAVEREIHYRDVFAPPSPEDLVALPEEGHIRLRWRASSADDVAGYHLFRADPNADFRRLNEDPLNALEYIDSGLVGGLVYRYRLTAVDREGNESEPGEAIESRAQ